MPSVHSTTQYENNRAEVSHEPTWQRERQMRRFKSPGQPQRLLGSGLVSKQWDATLETIRKVGRRGWQRESGYRRQGTVENLFFK